MGERERQPPKKVVVWSAEAKAELRAIDRETALHVLRAIDHYLSTGVGDVIKLQAPRFEFRLRAGDYRVIFPPCRSCGHRILHVRHRSNAYR